MAGVKRRSVFSFEGIDKMFQKCAIAFKIKKRQPKLSLFIEVTTRFELVIRELQSLALPLGYVTVLTYDSDGNRTRVTAVKRRCLDRLTTEP